ncbi:MAG: GGDEF domain-containing protein [Clostridiales bacterium]|nr:GGDEF domain-containing protein [Clostridiales bacterium]
MRICAFIGDMYRDYSTVIIKHLQKRAIRSGHKIDIYGNCAVPSDNPLHTEGLKSVLKLPSFREYDGIILCADTLNHAGLERFLLDRLRNTAGLPPVISIRCNIDGFYNIVPNNKKLMYDMTKHVLSQTKCGDIGFVTGKDDMIDAKERRAGFEEAMNEAGYEVSEDMIFHGNYWVNLGPEMSNFFIREDGTLPKAIICSNDYMAFGLIDSLLAKGYKIPADTMVTGIDNLEGTLTRIPSITTANISEETFANTALDMLEDIIAGKPVDKCVLVPGEIIIRESTNGTISRDLEEAFSLLETAKNNYYSQTLAFGRLSAEFQDVMSSDACAQLILKSIRDLNVFEESYICEYGENSRFVSGYFNSERLEPCHIEFPQDALAPVLFENDEAGVRIFLPIYFKNEVYGYMIFKILPDPEAFFDERLEFMLMLLGQTINRLQLYQKFCEFSDIMDLYVRDGLTGIYNRRGFEKRISALMNNLDPELKIAIASVDMDDLKYINDTFGHSAGDEAIKLISKHLKASLMEGEFVARMGGDEFTAVLILREPARIGQFIRNFRTAIKDVNQYGNRAYTLSASIGTCEVDNWDNLMEAINEADKIMYVEKRTKKDGR